MSCAECYEFWGNKGKKPVCKKCERHKTKPEILPENYGVLELLNKYGNMIYNGENIDSNGIKFSFDLEYIRESDKALFTRKIIAYFSKVIENQNQKIRSK